MASNVLNPAIIGDIFASESRGSGMSLVMLAPLIGGTIGPAIGGAMAETLGWRNILWMCAGVAILCEILFFTLLRETYKVTILQQRAARLRKEMKDESLKCAFEAENGSKELWWAALRTAILRPVVVMLNSGVLQIMSFYAGFVFTFYYIMATSLPGMLRDIYGFSPAATGSAFICFSKSLLPHLRMKAVLILMGRCWSNIWNHNLQPLPGSHIRRLRKIPWRDPQTGVSAASHDWNSNLPARGRVPLRMGTVRSLAGLSPAIDRSSIRNHLDCDLDTPILIYCRCFRNILGICHDDGSAYPLYNGHSTTAGDTSSD